MSTSNSTSFDDNEKHFFEPIHPAEQGRKERRSSQENNDVQRPRSIDRVYSLSDGYSHHTTNADEEKLGDALREGNGDDKASAEAEEFTVSWDGPNDTWNPRNMSLGRKWLIVLIVSMGSVCAYGNFSFSLSSSSPRLI